MAPRAAAAGGSWAPPVPADSACGQQGPARPLDLLQRCSSPGARPHKVPFNSHHPSRAPGGACPAPCCDPQHGLHADLGAALPHRASSWPPCSPCAGSVLPSQRPELAHPPDRLTYTLCHPHVHVTRQEPGTPPSTISTAQPRGCHMPPLLQDVASAPWCMTSCSTVTWHPIPIPPAPKVNHSLAGLSALTCCPRLPLLQRVPAAPATATASPTHPGRPPALCRVCHPPQPRITSPGAAPGRW